LIRHPDGTKKKRKEIGNKCFKKSVSFQLTLFSWPNFVEELNLSSFLFWLQLFLEKSFRLQTKQNFFVSQNLKQIKNNRGDPILSKTFFPIPPLPTLKVCHTYDGDVQRILMRATWVCLSVSLPRQCVNYKKPRDDVHTHTQSRDGLPSFISRQHNGKGEREKNGSFYFWYLPGGCAPPCVCVCDMHIFQEGRYYWEFETFLSPLSARAIFYDFVFIFVFRQIPSGRGSCVPFDSFSQPSFLRLFFLFISSAE
jgi:hypothetical protein